MEPSQILPMLLQVCTAFFDRLERTALVSRILDAAIELTHGDRGSVFLAPEKEAPLADMQLTSLVATGMGGKEIRIAADQGIVGHVFKTALPIIINDAHSDPRFFPKVDAVTQYRTETILCVPMRAPSGRNLGAIQILNSKRGRFEEDDLQILQVLALFAAVALEHRRTIENLTEVSNTLQQERRTWGQETESFVLRSSNGLLQELYNQLPAFAQSDSSILIEGESGTGKEVVAKVVHSRSARRNSPFVALNCAAIPESLFEAELFGVTKGAATGTFARKGKIEMAHGGTLFLDEIGELPLSMQAKLLRVLQDKTVTPVGSDEKPKPVDFRIVAATNRELESMVRAQRFREDLYYRINVVRFRLPALRERTGDIGDLSQSLLNKMLAGRARRLKKLSPDALAKLMAYPWPGNIRQLQNKLESAIILSGDRDVLSPQDFQLEPTTPASMVSIGASGSEGEASEESMGEVTTLKAAKDEAEKKAVRIALAKTQGNKSHAAKLLGLSREGLRKVLEKHKLAKES
ncbi:MAG: sigma 54-interacting transcriptional regulator [Bacteriovoracia bacterium]